MTTLYSLLFTGADGRWQLGIGDPTLVGWLTVIAYLVASALCLRAYITAGKQAKLGGAGEKARKEARLLSWFWLGLFLVLLLLLRRERPLCVLLALLVFSWRLG